MKCAICGKNGKIFYNIEIITTFYKKENNVFCKRNILGSRMRMSVCKKYFEVFFKK
jgi:hypothetical protein